MIIPFLSLQDGGCQGEGTCLDPNQYAVSGKGAIIPLLPMTT
jgi:hypothetical protein